MDFNFVCGRIRHAAVEIPILTAYKIPCHTLIPISSCHLVVTAHLSPRRRGLQTGKLYLVLFCFSYIPYLYVCLDSGGCLLLYLSNSNIPCTLTTYKHYRIVKTLQNSIQFFSLGFGKQLALNLFRTGKKKTR